MKQLALKRALRPSLTVSALPVQAMKGELLDRWQAIQDAFPAYASPFLGPGYACLVAGCGRDVRVGILERDGDPVGFFPFELVAPGHGKPVGTIFCDYQAVIARPDVPWTVEELLKGSGLNQWDYDHLLAAQAPFMPFHTGLDQSPFIDLSQGYDAYARHLAMQKRQQLVQAGRRFRQMERAFGSVRFTAHDPDPVLLHQLLSLKSAQWTASGWPGRFEPDWEQALMRGLMSTDTPAFGGLLSVLRVGGRPVALHLGPRSRTVWHYWTTAYDPGFAQFSPGIVLLDQMARAARSLGLSCIDLGKQDFRYKRRLMTGAVDLAEGGAFTMAAQQK